MLHDLLAEHPESEDDQNRARRALKSLYCWPTDSTSVRAWIAGAEPPEVSAGETCLVTVSRPAGHQSALWQLSCGDETPRDAHVFVDEARRVLDLAGRIARQEARFIASPRSGTRSRHWYARLLFKVGAPISKTLDGGSFGLAMLLAALSDLSGSPLPTTIISSVGLDASGRVCPVAPDSLLPKLEMVAGSALGVQSFVVHASQVGLLSTHRLVRPVRIVGVSQVSEALDLYRRAGWQVAPRFDAQKASELLTELYDAQLEDRLTLLSDEATRSMAELLERQLSFHPPSVLRARRIRMLASCVEPEFAKLIPDDRELRATIRPRRLGLLRKLVEVLTRNGHFDEALLRRSEGLLAPVLERDVPDFRLLASVARAYAAIGREKEAWERIQQAVAGLDALRSPSSEWQVYADAIRWLALRHPAGVRPFLERYADLIAESSVVRLGVGVAFVLLGESARAIDALTSVDEWTLSERDRLRRRRWLALALDGLDDGKAAGLRRELVGDFASFGRLDVACFHRDHERVSEGLRALGRPLRSRIGAEPLAFARAFWDV